MLRAGWPKSELEWFRNQRRSVQKLKPTFHSAAAASSTRLLSLDLPVGPAGAPRVPPGAIRGRRPLRNTSRVRPKMPAGRMDRHGGHANGQNEIKADVGHGRRGSSSG